MKTIVAIKIENQTGLWEFPTKLAANDFINDCLKLNPGLEYSISRKVGKSKSKAAKNARLRRSDNAPAIIKKTLKELAAWDKKNGRWIILRK